MAGKLFVIATPLGNLDDISRRALETLRAVDLVACEDTRRTSRLLDHYGIRTPLISCHKFNERERLAAVLERLRDGRDVALVTDSGSPAVSDPGALLVHSAQEEGLELCPIPGPSAVTTLLSVCGFNADRYVFEGFLPHRGGERRRRLRDLNTERRTVVLFETPHRILDALADIAEVLGERPLVLGRELTKLHETILHGTAREIAARLGDEVRGEFTLVLSGATPGRGVGGSDREAERVLEAWREALAKSGDDRRAALRIASRALGLKKAELQRLLMELGESR